MNLLNLLKHASGSSGSAIGLVLQYFVRSVQLLDANDPRPFLRANGRLRQTNVYVLITSLHRQHPADVYTLIE